MPSYRGNFEIHKTEEGLLLINELLLEEYLYAVVPSEMPSTKSEQELAEVEGKLVKGLNW